MDAKSSLNIFVVENHPDTLTYLRLYLETLGHCVSHAETVAEALEKIPTTPCDVLVCDIGLPDGDGWTLMRRLESPVYAIAMSGFGMSTDRTRSREAGFRHHLTKPFELKLLNEYLEEAAAEKTKMAGERSR